MSNPSPVAGNASSYLDTRQLGQLRGQASKDPAKAVRATAEQFESYFIQQMITAMRKTVEKSDLVESDKMDTYQDMMDKELANSLTKRGGIGLADVLERQLTQRMTAAAAPAPVDAVAGAASSANAAPGSTASAATSAALALAQHPGMNKGIALKPAIQALPLPTKQVLPIALPAAQGALPLAPAPGTQPIQLTTKDVSPIATPVPLVAPTPAPAASDKTSSAPQDVQGPQGAQAAQGPVSAWTPKDSDIDGWIRWQQKQTDPVLMRNLGELYAEHNPGQDPLADPAMRAFAVEQLQRERGNNLVVALNGGFPASGVINSSSDPVSGAIMISRNDGKTDIFFPDGSKKSAAKGEDPYVAAAAYSGPTTGNYGMLDSVLLTMKWQQQQSQA
ncbi:MAG: hypothetical protein EBS99_12095 [Betaproteobacteria bacterium]|nr:hypothetical protein [Betaproteobacteria bacterium]